MSMMADMLSDMLKKSLPPEVMEMLTAENIKQIGDKANAFISELRSSLTAIEDNQTLILKKLERMENGGSNSDYGSGIARSLSAGTIIGSADTSDGQ